MSDSDTAKDVKDPQKTETDKSRYEDSRLKRRPGVNTAFNPKWPTKRQQNGWGWSD